MLLTYLLTDITELDNETMQIIRTEFSNDQLKLQIELDDKKLLNGLINFLRKVDPHLSELRLNLSENVDVDHFSKIVATVAGLTRKVIKIFELIIINIIIYLFAISCWLM